jgi:hypothetical protein
MEEEVAVYGGATAKEEEVTVCEGAAAEEEEVTIFPNLAFNLDLTVFPSSLLPRLGERPPSPLPSSPPLAFNPAAAMATPEG